jgi:predicted nucleic-acid-binding protein
MRLGTDIYSIDANVILRFLLGDAPELYQKAYDTMAGIEAGSFTVICDPVNLAEVVWVLKSVYKLSNERIRELLDPLVNLQGFLMQDKERYLLALKMFGQGVTSFGDACACATAILNCGGKLCSFDAKLSKVKDVVRFGGVG